MDIFISYAYEDASLAEILKKELKKQDIINEVFISEQYLTFNKDISNKITDAIIKSDFVIALLTKQSKYSISVGQEIGFAYNNKIVIPLVEGKTHSGVLLTGREKFIFNKHNFKEIINTVIQYIIKKDLGCVPKDVTPELLRKSAHYRSTLDDNIQFLLRGIYYRFNISGKNYPLPDTTWNTPHIQMIDDFFKDEYASKKTHMLNIDFKQIRKLMSELLFVKEVMDEETSPHTEFPQDEHDLIIELLKGINDTVNYPWSVMEYSKYADTPNLCFKQRSDISKFQIGDLKRKIGFVYQDVSKITTMILKLSKLYYEYNKQFPNTAFK